MKKILCDNSIYKRFFGLYLIGLLLFIAAWYIGYCFLPEGIMRGTNLASKLAGSDISVSIREELTRIFVVNLLMSMVIILFNLSIRINKIPLGYLIPPIWFLLYGFILGSNSFTFAMTERIAPSLAVMGRSGLYELAAYTLITVSTYNISKFEIKALFKTNPEKINKPIIIQRQQYIGLIIAVLILLFSNIKEAFMLTSVF